MKKTKQQTISTVMCILIVGISIAHGQTPVSRNTAENSQVQLTNLLAQGNWSKRPAFSLMPPSFNVAPMAAGPNLTVLGGGTLGRLTKWTGFTSSNSFIGDSMIFEDKNGLVGIGTDSPTSKLTVNGLIQSLGGGFKFPDGSVQTTSASGALFTVAHDTTLTGNGTSASPLGVASPLEVRDLDNPARQPVQATGTCTIDGNGCRGLSFSVPAGKRLVIEYASMLAVLFGSGGGEVAFFEIRAIQNGNTVAHRSSMSQPAIPDVLAALASVGQQVRIYADPGTNIVLGGFRSNTGGTVTFEFTISGYLVDIP